MSVSPGKNRQQWVFLLILFTTSAGFFIPMPSEGWIGFGFKGILFFIDLLCIAIVVLSGRPLIKTKAEGESESDESLGEQDFKEESWEGYGNAFKWLSHEYLSVICQTFSATTAAFYLRNKQGVLQIHTAAGQGRQLDEKFTVEGSLISRIFQQKAPYQTGELPKGSVLPGLPEIEIRSFIGVPLAWKDKVIGVLALGSTIEEDFSEEDSRILTQCGVVLTRIMAAYHRGFRIETDYEIAKIRFDLEMAFKAAEDEDAAIRSFVGQIEKLFPFERFTLCLLDGSEGLIRYVYGQMDHQKPGMRFSLNEGLVGWVIKRKVPLLIPDIGSGEYLRPRYSRGEDAHHGLHSFLCVPLGAGESFKGCLSIESRNANQYNGKIKDIFQQMAEQLDFTLERMGRVNRSGVNPKRPETGSAT